ncbi:Uncharacterised protein [Escherichia coli]|nr:Uncharacterised protein [Escherichia coli]
MTAHQLSPTALQAPGEGAKNFYGQYELGQVYAIPPGCWI